MTAYLLGIKINGSNKCRLKFISIVLRVSYSLSLNFIQISVPICQVSPFFPPNFWDMQKTRFLNKKKIKFQ